MVGRGIRYGEPPTKWWTPEDIADGPLRGYFEAEYKLRAALVREALVVARMIELVEVGEVVAQDDPVLNGYRRKVEDALALLRESLNDIDDVDEVVEGLRP